jgi:hypothetical protein
VLDITVNDNQGLLVCHDLFDTMRQANEVFHLDILKGLKEMEFDGNGVKNGSWIYKCCITAVPALTIIKFLTKLSTLLLPVCCMYDI